MHSVSLHMFNVYPIRSMHRSFVSYQQAVLMDFGILPKFKEDDFCSHLCAYFPHDENDEHPFYSNHKIIYRVMILYKI